FKRAWHFSEPFIGSLMALNGFIITLVEMVVVYSLARKGKNVFFITIGVALVGLSFFALNIPYASIIIAIFMIMLISFGEIFSMPFMNSYWLSRTQHGNQGQYAALYTMAWSAAQTLGPMSGAQVAQIFGFKWLWWITGSLSLLVSLIFYRLYRKNKV
ncbi:MAG: MFS transporter, partial [Bacteroidota bacterium]